MWTAALILAGAWVYSKRAASYARLHPELRSPLLRFRSPSSTPTILKIMRNFLARFPEPTDVDLEPHHVPGLPSSRGTSPRA